MAEIINIWPALFVGFWAYPFIAIPHMRQRRLVMDLAAIGSGQRPETYAMACSMIRDLQAKMQKELAAEEASRHCSTDAQGQRR